MCLTAGRYGTTRSEWHVRPYLDRGELVRVLPHLSTPAADVYALLGEDGHVPRRVSALVDHLAAHLPPRLGQAADTRGAA